MHKKESKNILESIIDKRSKIDSHSQQTYGEFLTIIDLVEKCNFLNGDFAEIGTYEGFTAEIIFNFMKKDKRFYLCDTFDGILDISKKDTNTTLKKRSFKCGIDKFREMNKFCYEMNVSIVNGYFPKSATKEMDESQYAFVHIDTDTYNSTFNSLEYFYNRMATGGIMLVHDYVNNPWTEGVRKAVNNFLCDKKDLVLTIGSNTQGIITKE